MLALSAMNFLLITALILSHNFRYDVFLFSFNFQKFLILFFISILIHFSFNSELFSFHEFVNFLLSLISSFIFTLPILFHCYSSMYSWPPLTVSKCQIFIIIIPHEALHCVESMGHFCLVWSQSALLQVPQCTASTGLRLVCPAFCQ